MIDRAKELVEILRSASVAYYVDSAPELSDSEYDNLRNELEELDPSNDFLKEVGAPASNTLSKVKHTIPMGSLKKINNESEFNTWVKTIAKSISNLEMSVQWKLDGVSIEIVYKSGNFVQAITRGDGVIGEDVTHTIKNASGFPKQLSKHLNISVRGECILKIPTWQKHLENLTANPRNAASGIVRRTDGTHSDLLNFIAFDVIGDMDQISDEKSKIAWLAKNNFDVTSTETGKHTSVPEIVQYFEKIRSALDFEVDGVVVKINNIKDQNVLGEHDSRPYWARAWKFAPMGGNTILNSVEWSVGTHGSINPVGKVSPVKVGGTLIQNVTLHNMDEIERLEVAIGDTIEIVRAGDVIPKVIRVVNRGNPRNNILIHKCPACGYSVTRDGPKIFCSQREKCPGSSVRQIEKWISKRSIMFLGSSNLDLLIKSGLVKSIVDLYKINKNDLVKSGVGERMSEKIMDEIEKSKKVTLHEFLGSLSLDMLGQSEASNLVNAGFTKLSDWENISVSRLLDLDGYQETKSSRIVDSVKNNWNMISELSKYLEIIDKSTKNCTMSGMSFCFTGSMSKGRKELEEMVLERGGEIRSSVSKDLSYLVVDDTESSSSKNQKAKQLGVNRISESTFLSMVS